MGKYTSLEKDVFSVFNSAAWILEAIKTFPGNFTGKSVGNEYIRVTIIPGGAGINKRSAAGQLSIDIFTPAGGGPNRASLIADKLDDYIANKSLKTGSGVT